MRKVESTVRIQSQIESGKGNFEGRKRNTREEGIHVSNMTDHPTAAAASDAGARKETPQEKAARYRKMIMEGNIGDGGAERKRRRKERKKEKREKKEEKKRRKTAASSSANAGAEAATSPSDIGSGRPATAGEGGAISTGSNSAAAVAQNMSERGDGDAAAAVASTAGSGGGGGGGAALPQDGSVVATVEVEVDVELKPLLPPSGWKADQAELTTRPPRPGSKKEAKVIAEAVAGRSAPLWVRCDAYTQTLPSHRRRSFACIWIRAHTQ